MRLEGMKNTHLFRLLLDSKLNKYLNFEVQSNVRLFRQLMGLPKNLQPIYNMVSKSIFLLYIIQSIIY